MVVASFDIARVLHVSPATVIRKKIAATRIDKERLLQTIQPELVEVEIRWWKKKHM